MKVTREGVKHAYRRAKHIAHSSWTKTKWAFDTADKLATLTAQGLGALGDRLDPDIRDSAGRALRQYGQTSRRFHAVNHNLGRIGDAIWDVSFEL